MIGLRIACDHRGCRRHFDVDAQAEGFDLPFLVTLRDGKRARARVALEGVITAPRGWTAVRGEGERVEGVRFLCTDHRGEA